MAVTFIFGVHNHQPLGNFDDVIAEAVGQAYRPFFETLRRFPAVRAVVHTSGLLLHWLDAHAPDVVGMLGELVARGQVEPLTGGLTEPILPLLPDHDKVAQVCALSDYIERRFGVRPRGMWLAERVWEPHLARPLAEAGVEYVLVDDYHFGLAGLELERLSGYYLTEEQGHTVAVFPISQRLRYLIPFAPAPSVFAALGERAASGGALTLVDDGEKFGVWPGTHQSVYAEGWLESFFEGLTRLSDVEIRTAAEYLDQYPPTGRVYLPTASYREMGEWVLSPEAGLELGRATAELERVGHPRAARFLHGGFWRNFLARYPEVNDHYRKMLRVSGRVAAALSARPDDPRLLRAREALWRAQCNDAYWHGIFGGVYLPHLRRAVKSALLDAEATLDEAENGPRGVVHEAGDLDGDGANELAIRTRGLSILLRPAVGGTVTELAYRPLRFDLADVLTRRPEQSHLRIAEAERARAAEGGARTIHGTWRAKETGLARLLTYDTHRRASLQEYVLDVSEAGSVESPATRVAFPEHAFTAKLHEEAEGVLVELRAEVPAGPARIGLTKAVRVRERRDELSVRYELGATERLRGRFAVRWNLTLTGPAGERYYRTPGGERASLESAAAQAGSRLELVDEWLGLIVALSWSGEGLVAWEPVYTVSLSEAGLERLWQGVAVTVSWPVDVGADPWTAEVTLGLAPDGRVRR